MKLSRNRTVRNAAWIIGCKIIQALCELIVSMLTARLLGPSNFGLINYAGSIVTFVAPVMYLGFSSILVRELIADSEHEGEILGTSVISCFCSGIICIFGVIIFAACANKGDTQTVIICGIYSLMLLARAVEIIMYWFQAHLLSKYTSVISLSAYIVVSIYKIVLLLTHKSLYWFALSYLLDYLIIAAAEFIVYKKICGKKLTFRISRFKKMFKMGKYYIISGMMLAVFSQTDRIMLKHMISDAATGYYSAAVACAGMTTFIFSAIIESFSPTIFESKKISETSFENNVKKLYAIVIFGALLQSIVITSFAKPIVLILYGRQYLQTIPALQIVVWYTAFSYIGSVRNRWMLAEGKEYLIWKIDLSGALANVFMNFILIPHFGIIGASVASLITQIFTNVVLGWIIKAIRPNNKLMLQSFNPKILLNLVKSL